MRGSCLVCSVASLLLFLGGCSKPADPGAPLASSAPPTPAAPVPSTADSALRAATGVGLDDFDKMRQDLTKLGNDFSAAVRDGHVDVAYALMSTPYKKGVPLSRFKSVTKNPYFKDSKQFVLAGTTGTTRSVTARGLLTGSSEVDVSMSCSKEEGGWKLNGFSVAGSPALPTP